MIGIGRLFNCSGRANSLDRSCRREFGRHPIPSPISAARGDARNGLLEACLLPSDSAWRVNLVPADQGPAARTQGVVVEDRLHVAADRRLRDLDRYGPWT